MLQKFIFMLWSTVNPFSKKEHARLEISSNNPVELDREAEGSRDPHIDYTLLIV